MKKFVFIITLLLFIPLTTQAKEFQHPIYGTTFNYPDKWEHVAQDNTNNNYFLIIQKNTTYNKKIVSSIILFDITYEKNSLDDFLYSITNTEKQELLTILENHLTDVDTNIKVTYSGIKEINGIPYIIIKFEENQFERWVVNIYKNNLLHSLLFGTNSPQNIFQDEWLEILDLYTKNL